MKTISLLKNPIQKYKWGSLTAIPELIGTQPSDTPCAELWMGAHPKASSRVFVEKEWILLYDLIKKNPEEILGKFIAEKFNNRFPYLFKVLAAASPLSIQAHPSKEQAAAGFKRENKLKIPFNAGNRNYKDANHKPECICAITPFWALNGFRPVSEILLLTEKINSSNLNLLLNILRDQPDNKGLKQFFYSLMTMDENQKKHMIEDIVQYAGSVSDSNPVFQDVFQWIIKLFQAYPFDIGVLFPFFLNLICLKPGQAMFLPAGELHSYLDGLGLELMANSDNVLRGGLTPKHIDISELLKTLNFTSRNIEILQPVPVSDYESVYSSAAQEFILSVISVNQNMKNVILINSGVQILFCISGKVRVLEKNFSMDIQKGESVLVPANVKKYYIQGKGILYKASVPE